MSRFRGHAASGTTFDLPGRQEVAGTAFGHAVIDGHRTLCAHLYRAGDDLVEVWGLVRQKVDAFTDVAVGRNQTCGRVAARFFIRLVSRYHRRINTARPQGVIAPGR